MPWREKKYHYGVHSWRGDLFTKQLKKWVKAVFLFGCYGCIFHGTGNSAQLCQNFGISGWGVWTPQPPPLGTPLVWERESVCVCMCVCVCVCVCVVWMQPYRVLFWHTITCCLITEVSKEYCFHLQIKLTVGLHTPCTENPNRQWLLRRVFLQRLNFIDISPFSHTVYNIFRRVHKTAKSAYYLRHFSPSVCLSARNNSAPAGWILTKCYISLFFENMYRNFTFH